MDHRTDEFAFNNSRRRSSNKSVPLSHTHRPIAALDGYNKLETLHRRLGHIPEHALKDMIRLGNVLGLGVTWDEIRDLHLRFCDECYMGKMRAFSRKDSISTAIWDILSYIGIDWKGTFPTNVERFTGFYLICDRRSNFIATYSCKSQSQILECLEDFIINIVEANGHKMKVLQSDSTVMVKSKRISKW
jgi:hypothetical protein